MPSRTAHWPRVLVVTDGRPELVRAVFRACHGEVWPVRWVGVADLAAPDGGAALARSLGLPRWAGLGEPVDLAAAERWRLAAYRAKWIWGVGFTASRAREWGHRYGRRWVHSTIRASSVQPDWSSGGGAAGGRRGAVDSRVLHRGGDGADFVLARTVVPAPLPYAGPDAFRAILRAAEERVWRDCIHALLTAFCLRQVARRAARDARPIAVSACLLGVCCRYDGEVFDASRRLDFDLERRLGARRVVPVCPESMAGWPTPRPPVEWQRDGGARRLVDPEGQDRTAELQAGVQRAVDSVLSWGVDEAILKERSPSCGVHEIYEDGRKVAGRGMFAAALTRAGVRCRSDEDERGHAVAGGPRVD